MDFLNRWIVDLFLREPVGLTSKQMRFVGGQQLLGNGESMKLHDQHGPFIFIQEAVLRNLVIFELANSEAFASHCSGSKRERLPRVSDIVQAIAISAILVLPRFAPGNAGQNKDDRVIGADQPRNKIP
jgi:hypothetical protein